MQFLAQYYWYPGVKYCSFGSTIGTWELNTPFYVSTIDTRELNTRFLVPGYCFRPDRYLNLQLQNGTLNWILPGFRKRPQRLSASCCKYIHLESSTALRILICHRTNTTPVLHPCAVRPQCQSESDRGAVHISLIGFRRRIFAPLQLTQVPVYLLQCAVAIGQDTATDVCFALISSSKGYGQKCGRTVVSEGDGRHFGNSCKGNRQHSD